MGSEKNLLCLLFHHHGRKGFMFCVMVTVNLGSWSFSVLDAKYEDTFRAESKGIM